MDIGEFLKLGSLLGSIKRYLLPVIVNDGHQCLDYQVQFWATLVCDGNSLVGNVIRREASFSEEREIAYLAHKRLALCKAPRGGPNFPPLLLHSLLYTDGTGSLVVFDNCCKVIFLAIQQPQEEQQQQQQAWASMAAMDPTTVYLRTSKDLADYFQQSTLALIHHLQVVQISKPHSSLQKLLFLFRS